MRYELGVPSDTEEVFEAVFHTIAIPLRESLSFLLGDMEYLHTKHLILQKAAQDFAHTVASAGSKTEN